VVIGALLPVLIVTLRLMLILLFYGGNLLDGISKLIPVCNRIKLVFTFVNLYLLHLMEGLPRASESWWKLHYEC